MNKRARNRLIGVTAIIVIVAVAVVVSTGNEDGALYRTVGDVTSDSTLVGERVSVGGTVVEGSWNRESNPMVFEIREEGKDDGPTIGVVYNGGVPSTFGDGVVAIVKGTLTEDGIIESDDMITKCPSKYETATGALSVESLTLGGENLVSKTVKVTGVVVDGSVVAPGGAARFAIVDEGATDQLSIAWEGALPAGMDGGSTVVVSGSLEADGVFVATDVALAEGAQ